MLILRLIGESFRFAISALSNNALRTILSLLGVTVGIFAIIAVFTLVDSLESKLRSSFDFLGSNNINVEKWPYSFGGGAYPWWEYMNRPYPSHDEFRFLEENLKNMTGITMLSMRRGASVSHESSSSGGVDLVGVSYGYADVVDVPIEEGRYFTHQEMAAARNVVVMGSRICDDLFPNGNDPSGKKVKINGLKYTVIGRIEEEGDGFLGLPSNDDKVIIPYKSFQKLYHAGRFRGIGTSISVRGLDSDDGLLDLENEIKGLMRRIRGLKPTENDDFALNRPEAISNFIGTTFDVISVAGWVIGSFSILVGGFGIANIMFVSVRERTPIIGIQKSLGAKNYFILLQFLFEAVFLSVLGGIVGLILVYFLTFIDIGSLELNLTYGNAILGLFVSVAIGVISGIVPAGMAARLDPVEAIRA